MWTMSHTSYTLHQHKLQTNSFGAVQTQYLGYIIDYTCIHVDSNNIMMIQDWLTPHITKLSSFLVLANLT